MKKLLFRVLGTLSALGAPFVFATAAHAAAITWSGAGTPVVDSGTNRITYDMSDTDNWVGGVAPTDGDSIIFPANGAEVDPGSSLSNDSNWVYIVNNDLPADTSLVGIQFTGNTGSSCYSDGDNNDRYFILGNAIELQGNIDNAYAGSCLSNSFPFLGIDITLTANAFIEANIGGYVGSTYEAVTVDMDTYDLDICDTSGTNSGWTSISVYGSFNGTGGELDFNCPGTLFAGGGSHGRVSRVAEDAHLTLQTHAIFEEITFSDGATLEIYSYPAEDVEFDADLVFEGTEPVLGGGGGAGGGCSSTLTFTRVDDPAYTTKSRVRFSNSEIVGSAPKYTRELLDIVLNGDLTFSENMSAEVDANVIIKGAIAGAGKTITARQGSYGKITIESASNTSASTGTVTAGYYTREITGSSTLPSSDPCYVSYTVSAGYKAVLKDATIENYTIDSYGRLGGVGTVVGDLLVNPFGVLAPGYSPGCINSGNLTVNGTYEVELGGLTACTQYDQTKVTGTVDVTGGTLSLIRYNNMVPRLNDSFVVIDNDGADAVTGTFAGLAQGASITNDGITYSISYTGGSGNDVVLVVTAVDSSLGAPNTGFEMLKAGIVLPVLAMLSGVALFGMRKLAFKK